MYNHWYYGCEHAAKQEPKVEWAKSCPICGRLNVGCVERAYLGVVNPEGKAVREVDGKVVAEPA